MDLPGTRAADDGHELAGLDGEVYAVEDVVARARGAVFEGDVLKLHLAAALGQPDAPARGIGDIGPGLEHLDDAAGRRPRRG